MEMATAAVRAAISARAACPALPTRRVGSGRRHLAAATEARAAATDDDESEPESESAIERGHVAIFATATTRRRLAVAVAASLALKPATPRCAAGTLTDLVKNSGVGGGPNLGLAEFDSPDLDYSFQYPRGWKVLRNRLRRGVIVSDFDAPAGNPKVYVEVVSAPPANELEAPGGDSSESRKSAIRRRAVDALVAPVENDNSGDGKLEAPPMRLVKDLRFTSAPELVGYESASSPYDYFTFSSETTTRSGYDVTRRHFAAATLKGGLVYTLSASATTDGFDETRARLFERIVASFVVN